MRRTAYPSMIALVGACGVLACGVGACGGGGEGPSAPDVSSEPAPEALEPILPPDPPAIPGDAITYRFVLGTTEEHAAGYVVRTTEEGYELEATDESGASRWRVTATGARGDVRAQLQPSERGVIVMVRAESGDFLDLVDAERGRVIGRTRFDADLTRAPLEAPPSAVRGASAWGGLWASREQGITWRGIELRARGLEPPIAIVRGAARAADAEPFWTFHDPYGCVGLALVETERTVIAAQYCEATRGVVVHALALQGAHDARERWVTRPSVLDCDAHTTSSNEIALQVEGELVRVWGQEPEVRYVSTLDLETGREIATIVEAR